MNTTVKILFVIDELEIGGAQNQILLLGRAIHEMGCKVSVAYFRDEGAVLVAQFQAAGFSVLPLNKKRRFDPAFLARFVRLFRQDSEFIILSFGYTANFWTRLALLWTKGPRVVTCVRDHIYIPVLPKPFENALIWLERLLAWKSLNIVANSNAAVESLVTRGVIPRYKSLVIPNGVDIQSFASRVEARERLESLLPPGTGPIIGCMARLVPVKDHLTLVRAARIVVDAVPDARFLIAGEGPERERIEALRTTLQLDNNIFLPGSLPGPLYLAGLDIAVLQSLAEGMPNFILEAMATEVPVVASRVGAIAEMLEDGKLGTLFAAGDHNALATGILTIINTPADTKASALAACAKAKSMRPAELAKQYLNLFQ